MTREQLNTQLDEDYYDRLDEHADDLNITNAEAARRAIRHYLDEAVDGDGADAMTAEEMRGELETLRNDLYDRLDDNDADDDKTVAQFDQAGGGAVEQVAGGLVGLAAIALVGGTILGPTAALVTGLIGFGVAAYLVTTQAIRSYVEDTTA